MRYWNYDRLAEVYDETRIIPLELYAFFKNEIRDYIRARFSSPPFNLLSIGLGTGRIESLLSSKEYQLFGIDIAHDMLKKLSLKRLDPPCYTTQADGLTLPFVKQFKVILLIQVIHLVAKYENLFNELRNFCDVLIEGNAYTETHKHPIYIKFFEILQENGWHDIREDEPKTINFNEYMQRFDFIITKKNKRVNSSIKNSQVYEGIRSRSFRSLWEVENRIFDKSLTEIDNFIIENKIEKNDSYQTESSVNLTFYELN
ncbi:MAG: class I SAM-dependent methyltransferase [Candidatus Heimdallarchaeota archaeon]|nr:class I SAM-dependent methyltransferase [Candidatus Heimdallarchaeota archaeon]